MKDQTPSLEESLLADERMLNATVIALRLQGARVEINYDETTHIIAGIGVYEHTVVAPRVYSPDNLISKCAVSVGVLVNCIDSYLKSDIGTYDYLELQGIKELNAIASSKPDALKYYGLDNAEMLINTWRNIHKHASARHCVINQPSMLTVFFNHHLMENVA